ncbi:MAG TPA: response regulator transcription factor [Clostridia bacterium]|nr:response regulator transcription factor [Clostridia bacterium]
MHNAKSRNHPVDENPGRIDCQKTGSSQHILSGKSNREIAENLFISENTVKGRARNILSKYDASSAELISISYLKINLEPFN